MGKELVAPALEKKTHVRGENSFAKVTTPDYSIYHTKEDSLAAVVHVVESCSSMTVERVEEYGDDDDDDDGYKAGMQIVTYDATRGHDGEDRSRVVLNFGEHGRELITTETAIGFLRCLSDNTELNRLIAKYTTLDPKEVRNILDSTIIKVIPMENENGRAKVEEGELCERKNGRGVDPNRNWSVDWGVKEPDYDPKEEYPGKKAFSEPEVKILKNISETFKPDVFINIHSGMEALFVPFDHRNTIAYGTNVNATLDVLHDINKIFCKGNCSIGSGGATVGYLAHGTLTDYLHQAGIPITSTWEIYGDEKASFHDCFRMFNPLNQETFTRYVDRWVATLVFFVTQLAHHPATHSKYVTKDGMGIPPEEQTRMISTNPFITEGGQQRNISAYYQPIAICIAAAILYTQRGSIISKTKIGLDKVKSDELLPRFVKRKKYYVSIR